MTAPVRTSAPCDQFTGKSEWGLHPEPWRLCVRCGWSKAQHNLPQCNGTLSIAGQVHRCDLRHPHMGLGCQNEAAQAVWIGNNAATTWGQPQ